MQQNNLLQMFMLCIPFLASSIHAEDRNDYMEEVIVTTKRGDTVNLQSMAEAVTSFPARPWNAKPL